ncbi:hypothetical protein TrispH2_011774, partial [Trichoplax sp. H2]
PRKSFLPQLNAFYASCSDTSLAYWLGRKYILNHDNLSTPKISYSILHIISKYGDI